MLPDMKEFIQSLQKSRGVSIGEIARLLGYKSQTSVARVMQGKANIDSVNRFCRLLKANVQLALDEQERALLDRIAEHNRLGSVEYATLETLRDMLRGTPPQKDPVLVEVQSGRRQTMQERYADMDEMHITLLNCETMTLFGSLAILTRREKVRVEHYMYSDQGLLRTAMTIRAVMPILYEANYYGAISICDREELLSRPRGILLADVMLCEYRRGEQPWYDLVIFQKEDEGQCFSFPGTAGVVHCMMEDMKARAVPIRNAYLPESSDDYTTYAGYCYALERNRAVYRIKPDFGMEQLPVDVLRRCFEEGSAGNAPGVDRMADELESVFRKRQNNARSKKNVQHHVYKQRAVWKFVRTGWLSDHFWGMRSLTVAERLQTLEDILEQHVSNPYCKLHFLEDEDAFCDEEFIYYDGMGLAIIKAGTDYDLNASHSETLITQPEFMRIYRNFFLHNILADNVQPEYKTRKILLEMIEYCKQHMDE